MKEPMIAKKDGFPVRVCLERYYGSTDPRARCLVWAEARRDVRWLARRVRSLLPVPAQPSSSDSPHSRTSHTPRLMLRDYWLPPAEPLCLLRPGDLVRVIPREDGCSTDEEKITAEYTLNSNIYCNSNKRNENDLLTTDLANGISIAELESDNSLESEDLQSISKAKSISDAGAVQTSNKEKLLRQRKRQALELLHCCEQTALCHSEEHTERVECAEREECMEHKEHTEHEEYMGCEEHTESKCTQPRTEDRERYEGAPPRRRRRLRRRRRRRAADNVELGPHENNITCNGTSIGSQNTIHEHVSTAHAHYGSDGSAAADVAPHERPGSPAPATARAARVIRALETLAQGPA